MGTGKIVEVKQTLKEEQNRPSEGLGREAKTEHQGLLTREVCDGRSGSYRVLLTYIERE